MAESPQMHNGFVVSPLAAAGFLGRVVGKQPRENAFIEIRNKLAEAPLRAVSATDVQEALRRYGWTPEAARPLLADVYRVALSHCAKDGELSKDEQGFLEELAVAFSLSGSEVAAERQKVLEDLLRGFVTEAIADEHITAEEGARLKRVGESFGLTQDSVDSIYGAEVTRVLQAKLDRAAADRRIDDDEATELTRVSKNFGVTIAHDDKAAAAVARMRALARIDSGDLPVVATPLTLQKKETCHGMANATLYELRSRTARVNYSGFTSSVRLVGNIRWRVGTVRFDRVQKDVMQAIDSGVLYVTNRRLLFDGTRKNVAVPLARIVSFTVLSDGLQVQKASGKDQWFVGTDADWERIGAVLEGVMRKDRA